MDGFDDPWEHIRLLSDAPRNRQMLTLLERHAKDAMVLEAGCGTGVLSCVAARLGARHVYAVEPSAQVDAARELVKHNNLGDTVEVIEARLEDLAPRPVDLAFSELLNAEPFAEGLLSVSRAAARWVKPTGVLAPRSLTVWAALVRAPESAREYSQALDQLARLERAHDLDFAPVREAFADPGPYAYVSPRVELASRPVRLYHADLHDPPEPEDLTVEVEVDEPGPVGGVALWFSAELDADLVMHNQPGEGGHWGSQVLSWPTLVGARRGRFALHAQFDGDGYLISPA